MEPKPKRHSTALCFEADLAERCDGSGQVLLGKSGKIFGGRLGRFLQGLLMRLDRSADNQRVECNDPQDKFIFLGRVATN